MLRVIYFICILFCSWPSWAQLFNPELIKNQTVPIVKVEEDVLFVPQNPTIKVGESVVIIRIDNDDVEVVAKGNVANVQDGSFLILVERKDILKSPKAGDRVVSVARLNPQEVEKQNEIPLPELTMAKPDPYEPGYAVLDIGPNLGDFRSLSSNQANQYKNYSFNYYDTHFIWFFDFMWRLGIEYNTTGGDVPLRSYDRQVRPTKYSETLIGVHYRFLPFWKELRPTIKVVTKSADFQTTNNDEYVVTTKGSGIGIGGNLHYLFGSNIFVSEKSFDWSLNRIYSDLVIFPDFHLSDGLVSRGESGRGLELDLKLGATILFYIKPVPFFKRFSVDVSAGIQQNSFTFQGEPKSAPDGFYSIPPNSTYEERQNYFKIMIGLRMEDMVAKALRSR